MVMIRTIIVDDEELSLLNLEKKLHHFPEVEVFKCYTTHEKILTDLENESVDVVFLDIEMKEINGLKFAEKILTIQPSIHIVFVTGHANYAVEAFEINSADYLLKPVTTKRLQKTIKRLQDKIQGHNARQNKLVKARFTVYCFGEFQVYFDEKPIKFKTAKVKELFAILVSHMGTHLNRDIIIEKLWPGLDYKNSKTYLHTSLSYLRKLLADLGYPGAITLTNQCYCLTLDPIYFDAAEFNYIAQHALNGEKPDIAAIEKAIKLYKGGFLELNGYEWGYEFTSRYQETFLTLLASAAQTLIQNDPRKAIAILKAHQKIDPYSEEVVLTIMEIYNKMGMRTEAILTYQHYEKQLEKELAIAPAAILKNLYHSLLH
ncbi:MAG TPA: response regulator [Bacillus sp. (in: firmicutes)]|nr:response regulator [Bacillus sp. (in: firmicutes)]